MNHFEKFANWARSVSVLLVFLVLMSAVALKSSATPVGGVAVRQNTDKACIENGIVRVEYDLAKGSYAIYDGESAQAVIEEAFSLIDEQSSMDPGQTRTWTSRAVKDPLGQGKALAITCSAPDRPTQILEITLYRGQGFLALNCGLVNTMPQPLQIKMLRPLVGKAFRGAGLTRNFSLLDGNSGGDPTQVSHDDVLSSKNNLLATFGPEGANHSLVIGGLTYHEFEKFVIIRRQAGSLACEITSKDPVGKRVDAGVRYLPDDRYYVDFTTRNPFQALERYALAVRAAQQANPAIYDFPTLCLWYSAHPTFGNGRRNNTSAGAVWELDEAIRRGFLKYSRLGIRLVPDNYDENNQQGWWDDAHWQKIANSDHNLPCYCPPYETSEKWGQAVTERGGVPLMYVQTSRRSDDYCAQYPGHMLFNNDSTHIRPVPCWWDERLNRPSLWGYDFTDPDFLKHMEDVYANMKRGGIKGLMFDYPDTGWASEGGFEDPYATTAAAYRRIFELPYRGLGQPNWVHERNIGVGSDITAGLVASQRTMGDNDRINPAIASVPGLRWYKNRVLFSYDMDAKNPDHAFPNNRDGVRAMFTMCYVAGGRLLLGRSFEKMTDDNLYDLTRTVPYHATPQSARPVDAFTGAPYPQVYDFAVDPSWHLLTFYNTTLEGATWSSDWMSLLNQEKAAGRLVPAEIGADLSRDPAFGGLGLDPQKSYYVYDFWNERFVGQIAGSARLQEELRPGEARMYSIHEVQPHPQFISTNRHIMQGYLDMESCRWHGLRRILAGRSKVIGGETYKVIVATNGRTPIACKAKGATARIEAYDASSGLAALAIDRPDNATVEWTMQFK